MHIKIIWLFCVILVVSSCKDKVENSAVIDLESPLEKQEVVDSNKIELVEKNLPTLNIKEGEKLISPVIIHVNSQGLWFANEGELGWAELWDKDNQLIAKGILTADGDWMKTGPVMFSTTLEFNVVKAQQATLIIRKNPGAGEGDEAGTRESFEIPVLI